jgi:acyl phosphate:glycerol-3-phosphate acyltransferase
LGQSGSLYYNVAAVSSGRRRVPIAGRGLLLVLRTQGVTVDLLQLALAIVVAYLSGAIPVSRLASLLLHREEAMSEIEVPVPGTEETYKVTSMGAAAASMKFGAGVGCTIGFLDILKVLVPVLVFKLINPDGYAHLAAAVAGMVGHNWSVFNRFKGGRGISSAYGGLLVVDWLGALVCAVGGLLFGLFVLQDFIFAYMAGLWLAIPWLWFRTRDPIYLLYIAIINVLFVVAMIPDLRQYLRLRKQGAVDLSTVMETTPMGRGMMKMMQAVRRKRG